MKLHGECKYLLYLLNTKYEVQIVVDLCATNAAFANVLFMYWLLFHVK